MKQWILAVLAFVFCIGALVGCTSKHGEAAPPATTSVEAPLAITGIAQLQHTEHFAPKALDHIFDGAVNREGQVVGYHYEGIPGTEAHVKDGTRSTPDRHGVYTGTVYIGTHKKEGNAGHSTFFPKRWTAQEVVDAINEAYAQRKERRKSQYEGRTRDGMRIVFYLDQQQRIMTAYPLYER